MVPAAASSKPADEASSSSSPVKAVQVDSQEKPQQKQTTTPKKKADSSMRYPFWFGGSASSMAACVTHPLDLAPAISQCWSLQDADDVSVKVRLQVRRPDAPKNMVGTFAHIVRNHGITGLYNGLSASLLRQMTYSTVRFGAYEEMKVRATRKNNGKAPAFPVLVAMASASGFV
ncbi:unnamed protein product, partial [Colletotrichum noveboracense]